MFSGLQLLLEMDVLSKLVSISILLILFVLSAGHIDQSLRKLRKNWVTSFKISRSVIASAGEPGHHKAVVQWKHKAKQMIRW